MISNWDGLALGSWLVADYSRYFGHSYSTLASKNIASCGLNKSMIKYWNALSNLIIIIQTFVRVNTAALAKTVKERVDTDKLV